MLVKLAFLISWLLFSSTGLLYAGPSRDLLSKLQNSIELLPPGAAVAAGETRELRFRITPKPNHLTVLASICRMQSKEPDGFNYTLALFVNGKIVSGAFDRMRPRLLVRPMLFRQIGEERLFPWFQGDVWGVRYAPDFEDHKVEGGDDCVLLLDITDLVHPGENTLRLEHRGKALEDAFFFGDKIPFVFERLTVGLLPKAAQRLSLPPIPIVKAKRVASTFGARLSVTEGGALVVRVGKERFDIVTAITYPQGKWNRLAMKPHEEGCEPSWKPKIKVQRGRLCLVASGDWYRLERTVRKDRHRFVIEDRVTNLKDEPIGFHYQNAIDSTGREVKVAALAGDPDPSSSYFEFGRVPTLCVRQGKVALGIVAYENLYRAYLVGEYKYPLGTLRAQSFGLAPKASHTFVWHIYPVTSGDPWDFINQVRRDWAVNFTIPGTIVWLGATSINSWPEEHLKKFLQDRGCEIVFLDPWLNVMTLPHYGGSTRAWAKAFKQARERLRNLMPKVRLIALLHPTMVFSKPGEGFDSPAYRDSFCLTEDGSHAWSETYTKSWCTEEELKSGWRNFLNYPEGENSMTRELRRLISFALDECRLDGIYFDGFAIPLPRETWGRWDRHTVDLDSTTFVLRHKPNSARIDIISMPTLMDLVREIRAQGKLVFSNGSPHFWASAKHKYFSFHETAVLNHCYGGLLWTPIALGWGVNTTRLEPKDDANSFREIRMMIEYCSLYAFYSSLTIRQPAVTTHMYPFTPVDIRPGCLVGKERVILSRTLNVLWWDATPKVRQLVYDANGTLISDKEIPWKASKRRRVKVPEAGCVVLERIYGTGKGPAMQ